MKIIVAGYPKTGTKTLNAALIVLGYQVYDFLENFWFLRKEWNEIMTKGGSRELFKQMYQNVDAVTDAPAAAFWKEIHEAFPDAKAHTADLMASCLQIILMTRDDEENWLESMKTQIAAAEGNFLLNLLMLMTPSGYGMTVLYRHIGRVFFGTYQQKFNRTLLLRGYRQHNCHVMHAAPKDKLLVYNVSGGWEPLCKFLGHSVPTEPFPHKNKDGQAVQEAVANHPVMKRLKIELCVVAGGFTVIGAIFLLKFQNFNLVSMFGR
ncbi:unnamed protein product [Clavelina lepadiformis]|uniref:Uncharacterized protein n=1 Tax=Clavelina lepadiformis TaxID=159417 RepID=A0ABP0GQX6_CLALP